MKSILKKCAVVIYALFLMCFAVGYSFAWFTEERGAGLSLSGSAQGAYFESGDGTADSPFMISNVRHLQSLAILQNRGLFQTQKYYFKLKNQIDAGDVWLPPIGTNGKPFIGQFDGNGQIISNLKITDDTMKTAYALEAGDSYAGVGFFGNVDTVTLNNVATKGTVQNFYLDDTYVLNNASDVPTGLICGYYNGLLSQIGVTRGRLAFGRTQQSTGTRPVTSKYSLIGDKGESAEAITEPSTQPGTGGAGGDLLIDGSMLSADLGTAVVYDVPANQVAEGAYIKMVGEIKPQPPKERTLYNGIGYYEKVKNDTAFDYTIYDAKGTRIGNEIYTSSTAAVAAIPKTLTESGNKPTYTGLRPRKTPLNENWGMAHPATVDNKQYAQAAIHFKAICGGTCKIVITTAEKKVNELALFMFSRNGSGAMEIQKEVAFCSVYDENNYTHNYFEYTITNEEAQNYEFMFAAPSGYNGTIANFAHLELAGTSITGGNSFDGAIIKNVDFLTAEEFAQLTGANHTAPNWAGARYSRRLFQVTGTAELTLGVNNMVVFYFWREDSEAMQGVTKYYTEDANNFGTTVLPTGEDTKATALPQGIIWFAP